VGAPGWLASGMGARCGIPVRKGVPRKAFVLWWLALACGLVPSPASGQAAAEELRSGWFIRPPYMMERQEGNLTVLTGLEIQFARKLFEGTGYRAKFEPLSWAESLQGLRLGTVDFVTGAYEIESRKEYAHYSIPYRHEEMVLYYRRGDPGFAEVRTLAELFSLLRQRPSGWDTPPVSRSVRRTCSNSSTTHPRPSSGCPPPGTRTTSG